MPHVSWLAPAGCASDEGGRDGQIPGSSVTIIASLKLWARPIDLIPDFIPVFGYLDDLIVVPLGILLAVKLVPAELMTEFRAEASRRSIPSSRAGLAFIAAIWIVVAVVLAWLFWPGPA